MKTTVLDESKMRSLIADELKDMRKGKGIPGVSMKRNSIIVAAYEGYPALLNSHMQDELEAMGDGSGATALAAALALVDKERWPELPERPAEELTTRRRAYAQAVNINERTASRHEDEAIETLSWRLASRFRDEPYKSRIEKRYTPPGPIHHVPKDEPKTEAKRAAEDDLPNDIPGLLKLQAQNAAALEELTATIRRVNEKLATVWGIEL